MYKYFFYFSNFFVIGYTTQFMNHIFSALNIFQMPYLVRVMICLIGCFIVSPIGVTVYIFSDLGVAATDSIAEIISKKVKSPIQNCKSVFGSCFGFNRLEYRRKCRSRHCNCVFVGPFIQFSRKMLYPLLAYVLDRKSVDDVNSDDKKFEKEVVFLMQLKVAFFYLYLFFCFE